MVTPARVTAGLTGAVLALAAAAPAWAAPTPQDTDDPAYRAGYLFGRMLLPMCCLIVLVGLVAALIVLIRRRKERLERQRYQQYPYPPQPPYPPYR
ncbi:hypothetical protein GCM10010399_68850 [Dactylosporangium fulvum]